jgi:hypothetical protein
MVRRRAARELPDANKEEEMTERDIELADECHHPYREHRIDLKKFAALIRADEREACAKLADEIDPIWESLSVAIRARGST